MKTKNIPISKYHLTKYGRVATYHYAMDRYGYISSLRVRPEYRKMGYGRKLLLQSIQKLHRNGYKNIVLLVKTSSWMEEWYNKIGFKYLYTQNKYSWLIL